MNYNQLKNYAETCQENSDSLAYLLVKAKKLIEFQSLCDFNVFWLHDIAPEVVFHMETVDFLLTIKDKFKRKITAKEFMRYDSAVVHFKPNNFSEFKNTIR